LEDLDSFFDGAGMERRFLEFASDNGVNATQQEWDESKDVIMTQVKAFIGRYSPMDDNAFYPVLLKIDNVVQAAIGQ
jgi:carboxyl-terminal processing protease